MAKSSTEAEMIVVSDYAGELIAKNEFYIHQCGSNKPADKANKDFYFWLEGRVDRKYGEGIPTDDIIANILTRSLHGDQFIKLG